MFFLICRFFDFIYPNLFCFIFLDCIYKFFYQVSIICDENKSTYFHVPKILYENRYCNQEGFSILVCGGKDRNGKVTNEVLELKIPTFEVNKCPSMVKPHYIVELSTIKSSIVAVGDNAELDKNLGKYLLKFILKTMKLGLIDM